jgi:hypothetical protein
MVLVDEYDGDDDRSMAANNTSGYNCRTVTGGQEWSNHAFGTAIDINPVQNPYLTGSPIGSVVYPPVGRRYAGVDRGRGARAAPGVIVQGDAVVSAFAAAGWGWGGDWTSARDYQHFSASGS